MGYLIDLHICNDSLSEGGNTVPCSNKSTVWQQFAGGRRETVLRKGLPFLVCTGTSFGLVALPSGLSLGASADRYS